MNQLLKFIGWLILLAWVVWVTIACAWFVGF